MKFSHALVLVLSVLFIAGCKDDDDLTAAAGPAKHAEPVKDIGSTTGQPQVVVYKNASCGCCKVWIEHMQSHGFPVKAVDVDNLGPIKERVGVPFGMGSCHTAEVGGYFIEGHVPAADVQRLLTEKPKAKGLTVPGMPIGSPGMEQGDRVDPYEVLLVHEGGGTSVYSTYPQEAASRSQ
ncbi:MAG: DUF411 domain-containing protein [Steroidobacter sp.]